MKKILITGGAGIIGSNITKQLITQGHKVKILDNLTRGKADRLKGFINKNDFFSADIRDEKSVLKAAKGCDAIIHLAYINGTKFFYEKPDMVLDVAIKGMYSVLNAGKENKVKELFLASSSEAYQESKIIPTPEEIPLIVPDPYNPRFSYGGGKILCELMAIHMGKTFKKVVIFRPHNVYGPDMGEEHVIPQLIRKIQMLNPKEKNKSLKIQGSGDETRSFIFIDDFVEAFILLLSKAKHLNTYNIGTQEEITIKKLAFSLSNLFEYKLKIIPTPLAKGSTLRRCPDVSKLTQLGFKPKNSLLQGLEKTVDWYKEN